MNLTDVMHHFANEMVKVTFDEDNGQDDVSRAMVLVNGDEQEIRDAWIMLIHAITTRNQNPFGASVHVVEDGKFQLELMFQTKGIPDESNKS